MFLGRKYSTFFSHRSWKCVGGARTATKSDTSTTNNQTLKKPHFFFTQDQLKTSRGSEGDSAIHIAARKGDNDLVKLFIEAGTRVDTQNVRMLQTIK